MKFIYAVIIFLIGYQTAMAYNNEPKIIKVETEEVIENTPILEHCELEVVQCIGEEEKQQEEPILSELEQKICDVFTDNCELMIAIAKAESGLNPNTPPNGNTNGTIDTGIFRINSVHGYSQEYLENVDNNIKVAKKIYDTQGITAWVAYNNGSYKKFLN